MLKGLPHIFLRKTQVAKKFKNPQRGGGPKNLPERDPEEHGARLREQWAAIWSRAKEEDASRTAVATVKREGMYVEFEGAPGTDLITDSLEARAAGIRLLSVYSVDTVTRAEVFVPNGKHHLFLKKVDQYTTEVTGKGKPKHDRLLRSIENVRRAVLESFWRDNSDLIPQGNDAVWCEIWLRGTWDTLEKRFHDAASALNIEIQPYRLRFPERVVLLGKATRHQLAGLLEYSPDIAEFRRAKETARFFVDLTNEDQTEWVSNLCSRIVSNSNTNVSVCVMDTGANNGHPLLAPVLSDADCHTVEPRWGVNDHSGHGSSMCGIATFGDLEECMSKHGPVKIEHRLESVKILPPKGENDPALYGEITIQGMSRAEIQAPERNRVGCMAVTSIDGRDRGRPSSWSAAIDVLTSGYDDDKRRLMIVSAGNVDDHGEWANYPDSNLTYSVHDPGQSWNAITVGAFTEKFLLTDPNLQDHVPVAQSGELSPFSSTSLIWESRWPIKPEIVMEGGNLAKGPDGLISEQDDLSLLTIGHEPTRRHLTTINATSASAARAAWMAAQIQARYPDAWPETVRGLMIHAAEWPKSLKRQFPSSNRRGGYSKTEYGKLLRTCGYGVPNLPSALNCASNTLTLISEAELQPYTKQDGRYSTNEMHLHRLPWPRDILLGLAEMPVKLRITLSYFIEPGPGEVGWKDKYRYASHALRFDVNNPGEDESTFLKRINAASREEGESADSSSGSDRWEIGANARNTGSIHSDIWRDTAANIAASNLIAIYPLVGWWRERSWLNRWNRIARYTLIVTLSTPDETIDIYTPIAMKLGIPVQV